MNRTEARLRDAFGAAAETVRQDSLRPLSPPGRRWPPRDRGRPPRQRRWTAPLAVAAVTVLAVAGVTLPHRIFMRDVDATSRVGAPPVAMAVGADGRASVLDTASGTTVGIVPAPSGRFVAVAGTAPTFYLAAQMTNCKAQIYEYTTGVFDGPGDGLGLLPGGPMTVNVSSLALAPNGRQLAVSGACNVDSSVAVIDIRSATRSVWHVIGQPDPLHAAWAPDGRSIGLFLGPDPRGDSRALVVDSRRPGDRLLQAPVTRMSAPVRGGPVDRGRITTFFVVDPNGHALKAVHGPRSDHAFPVLEQLSARIGGPTGRNTAGSTVAADRSGQHLLVIIGGRIGRVDKGHFSWLTKTGGQRDIAW